MTLNDISSIMMFQKVQLKIDSYYQPQHGAKELLIFDDTPIKQLWEFLNTYGEYEIDSLLSTTYDVYSKNNKDDFLYTDSKIVIYLVSPDKDIL